MAARHRPYRKQVAPSVEPTDEELAWAAGFLEGEASFSGNSGKDQRTRIGVPQINREPLEKLLVLFGGTIYGPYAQRGDLSVWFIRGNKAKDLMLSLRPRMSKRRQGQIDLAIGL